MPVCELFLIECTVKNSNLSLAFDFVCIFCNESFAIHKYIYIKFQTEIQKSVVNNVRTLETSFLQGIIK